MSKGCWDAEQTLGQPPELDSLFLLHNLPSIYDPCNPPPLPSPPLLQVSPKDTPLRDGGGGVADKEREMDLEGW